jgi:hopanoid C-2 methylase
LFARFRYQIDATYANRLWSPAKGKLTKVISRAPLCSPWQALRRGQIEAILGMGFVARHLIQFTLEALGGRQNASFYAAKQNPTEA